MNKTLFSFGIIILPLCNSPVFAGGPLVIEGPDGNTPVTYPVPNITLHVESGNLNATVDNVAANTILQEAFNLWNSVNTSTINLGINLTALASDPDINLSNFDQYIPSLDGSELNGDDNLSPIVYDSNGEIIDAFFYPNASDDIVGFAASIFNLNGSNFNEGYAVINGKEFVSVTDTQFKLLIAHEIGHLFGLDHTQVNIDNQEAGFSICKTETQDNKYPVMYPFVCRNVESLHADEVSTISALYPATNINDSFGILQGNFVDESGHAILGANIWAENTTTGEAISIVSDYLKQGNGFYKMYLPPGNYTLHANSINELFNGGSSVGPYALDLSDKSFVAPHPIPEVTYQGAAQGNAAIITISSNQTLNISFSITGNEAVLINPPEESSGSSGTSYITLLLLLSFILLARYTGILNRRKLKTSFIIS